MPNEIKYPLSYMSPLFNFYSLLNFCHLLLWFIQERKINIQVSVQYEQEECNFPKTRFTVEA